METIPTPAATTAIPSNTDFIAWAQRMEERFNLQEKQPLFKTDISKRLYASFMASLPELDRQHHNCDCCKSFMRKFGDLVHVQEDGSLTSAIWNVEDAPDYYKPAVQAIVDMFGKAKIIRVFYTDEHIWGEKEYEWGESATDKYVHFTVTVHPHYISNNVLFKPHQLSAKRTQEFGMMIRALQRYSLANIKRALTILDTLQISRDDVLEPNIKWLEGIFEQWYSTDIPKHAKRNILWRAVADAPVGFANLGSTMTGVMLDDIKLGGSFESIKKSIASKTAVGVYRTPTAPPAAATIGRAEEIIAAIGAEESLDRRYARIEEICTFWKPEPEVDSDKDKKKGVFGHLTPKGELEETVSERIPATVMSWMKFQRVVLPNALSIELMVPRQSKAFCAITAAVNPDAPPILKWDSLEHRNPFSIYSYINEHLCTVWQLTPNTWVKVTGLCHAVQDWFKDGEEVPSMVIGILEGAKPIEQYHDMTGLALFPETLDSRFHEVRSVMQAFSNKGRLQGLEEASACGIVLATSTIPTHMRVKTKDSLLEYKIDRLE